MFGVGIVTYNPDIDRLKENIDAIYKQVKEIVIIDNNSSNFEDILLLTSEYNEIVLIHNRNNLGIAKAFNQIFEYFEDKKIEWILTLDQDTICPDNMISEYKKYINLINIAIISPIVSYSGDSYCRSESTKLYDYINCCISSGAFISLKAWKKIKGFDNSLFIDFVDFDFCFLLLENHYKIIRLNSVVINHELGDLKVYKMLRKKIRIMNHSSFRKYYYSRNSIICYKKHPHIYNFKMSLHDIVLLILKTILFEEEKYSKLKSISRGVKDGLKYKKSKSIYHNTSV